MGNEILQGTSTLPIDVGLKNRFKWSWLEEKDAKGGRLKKQMQRLTPGADRDKALGISPFACTKSKTNPAKQTVHDIAKGIKRKIAKHA